jgi:hypothetical protein
LWKLGENNFNIKIYTSSCKEIKHGVPQSAILGPILFFWFINDLLHAVQEAKVVLVADNTNIQDVWMKGIQNNKKNYILETNFHAHIKFMSSEKENSSFFFFVLHG